MTTRRWMVTFAALTFMGTILAGCATCLQNYDKVSLGMNPEEVLQVAGKPHRIFQMESTGQGTLIPTPPGKHEVWFYRGGVIQFNEGKVVAKGHKIQP
jgi:hypothetical protein